MTKGVIGQPYTLAMHSDLTRRQFYSHAQALLAERDQLKGLVPGYPPRPPDGEGLPRYGLRWNGPQQPLAVPMNDGYWTPWHLAHQLKAENEVLRKAIQSIAAQVDGNIRPTLRDGVSGQGHVQDIYRYCDTIEAIITGAITQESKP
ncbi:hypothetical protein N005_01475 [Pseudomonas mediterranea CFBP 5447]|nr:hypothetical protein N005_01475 [Pseudomonas mediterranea CFBP 5447]